MTNIQISPDMSNIPTPRVDQPSATINDIPPRETVDATVSPDSINTFQAEARDRKIAETAAELEELFAIPAHEGDVSDSHVLKAEPPKITSVETLVQHAHGEHLVSGPEAVHRALVLGGHIRSMREPVLQQFNTDTALY